VLIFVGTDRDQCHGEHTFVGHQRDFDTRPIPPISMNNSNWWYPSAIQGPAKTVFTCIAVVSLIEMKENHREDEILACCRSS
jgi:hypothetical protein